MSVLPVSDAGWIVREHRPELMEAVERVLDSGWYILGQEVEAFEEEFATWVGARPPSAWPRGRTQSRSRSSLAESDLEMRC